METDIELTSYLFGKIAALEARLAEPPQAPPAPAAPAPVPREPTRLELEQHFLDHVEEIAGVKPTAAAPVPETPPQSISRSSPTFQRQFAKWVDAVATGKTEIVE